MKVWLDDERGEPNTWVRARTAAEAIALLQSGVVELISLDHDLGDDTAGTGYDVLVWLERAVVERGFVPPAICVHTANPPARERMLAAIAAIEKLSAQFAVFAKYSISQTIRDSIFLKGQPLLYEALIPGEIVREWSDGRREVLRRNSDGKLVVVRVVFEGSGKES